MGKICTLFRNFWYVRKNFCTPKMVHWPKFFWRRRGVAKNNLFQKFFSSSGRLKWPYTPWRIPWGRPWVHPLPRTVYPRGGAILYIFVLFASPKTSTFVLLFYTFSYYIPTFPKILVLLLFYFSTEGCQKVCGYWCTCFYILEKSKFKTINIFRMKARPRMKTELLHRLIVKLLVGWVVKPSVFFGVDVARFKEESKLKAIKN